MHAALTTIVYANHKTVAVFNRYPWCLCKRDLAMNLKKLCACDSPPAELISKNIWQLHRLGGGGFSHVSSQMLYNNALTHPKCLLSMFTSSGSKQPWSVLAYLPKLPCENFRQHSHPNERSSPIILAV